MIPLDWRSGPAVQLCARRIVSAVEDRSSGLPPARNVLEGAMGVGDGEVVPAPPRIDPRLVWPDGAVAEGALTVPRWVADAAIDTLRFADGRSATLMVFGTVDDAREPALIFERRAGGREIAALPGEPPTCMTALWVIRVAAGRVAEPTADDRRAALRLVPRSPAPCLVGIEVVDGLVTLAAWELDRLGDALPVALVDGPPPACPVVPPRAGGDMFEAVNPGLEEAAAWELIRLQGALAARATALDGAGVRQDVRLLPGFTYPPELEAEARDAYRVGCGKAAESRAEALASANGTAVDLRSRVGTAESLPPEVLAMAGLDRLPPPILCAPVTESATDAVERFEAARTRLLADVRSRSDLGRARRLRQLRLAGLLAVACTAVGAGFVTGWLPDQVVPALAGLHLSNSATSAPRATAASPQHPLQLATTAPTAARTSASPPASVAPVTQSVGLLQAVSSRIRQKCNPASPPAGALAAAACTVGSVQITLAQYADVATATSGYADLGAGTGITADSGGCWDGSPGEVAYGFGRATCATSGGASVAWLDTRSDTVGTVTGTGMTISGLLDVWWNQVLLLNSPPGKRLTAEQQALADLLPAGIRSYCQGNDPTLDHQRDPRVFDPVGDIVAIDCGAPAKGIEDIALMRFTSQASLDGWYGQRFAIITSNQPLARGSGGCLAGSYGETAWSGGRAVCYRRSIDGHPAIRWTDGPQLVYGVINGGKGSTIATLTAWLTNQGLP